MNGEREEWRPVPLPELSAYQVSNLGRVKADGSLNKRIRRSGVRRLGNSNGWRVVYLIGDRPYLVDRPWSVHILVAAAFLGPRPEGMHVDHVNGVRGDNRVENLEYVTPAENSRRMWRRRKAA
jgi:HNH endonuclease/NUMOD4 motif-containing protein